MYNCCLLFCKRQQNVREMMFGMTWPQGRHVIPKYRDDLKDDIANDNGDDMSFPYVIPGIISKVRALWHTWHCVQGCGWPYVVPEVGDDLMVSLMSSLRLQMTLCHTWHHPWGLEWHYVIPQCFLQCRPRHWEWLFVIPISLTRFCISRVIRNHPDIVSMSSLVRFHQKYFHLKSTAVYNSSAESWRISRE